MKNLLKTAIVALAVFFCLSSYGVCSRAGAIEEAIERYSLEGRVRMASCETQKCNWIQALFGCFIVDCDEDLRPDGIRVWYYVIDRRMVKEDGLEWLLYQRNIMGDNYDPLEVNGYVIEYFDGDGVRQLKFIKFDC